MKWVVIRNTEKRLTRNEAGVPDPSLPIHDYITSEGIPAPWIADDPAALPFPDEPKEEITEGQARELAESIVKRGGSYGPREAQVLGINWWDESPAGKADD